MRRAARSVLRFASRFLRAVAGTPGDGTRSLWAGLFSGPVYFGDRLRETETLVRMERERMRKEEARHDDPAP